MSGYDKVLEMVEKWRSQIVEPEKGGKLKEILDHLDYLERVKFQPFLPALYSTRYAASFMERFYGWLTNPDLSDDEKKDLFQFADHIAFFSFDDFTALFQNAFNGPISSWCMDHAGIKLTDSEWRDRLDEECCQNTWFCPVTDSFLISSFHHVNEITNKDQRPAFRELMYFGDENPEKDENKISNYIQTKKYKRLVLLEDFVGTGEQTLKTVKWALKTLDIPIMFCPMIIGPEGAKKYRELERLSGGSFCYSPIFTLGDDCFVNNKAQANCDLFQRISSLAEKIHKQLEASGSSCTEGALGFATETSLIQGATAVMFSNTPNNALPLIWHGAENHWNPLFPRVTRQPI